MPHTLELRLPPDQAFDLRELERSTRRHFSIAEDNEDFVFSIKRRSIDARSRQPLIVLSVELSRREEILKGASLLSEIAAVSASAPRIVIIGAGPAGYFAALEALRNGMKPIVIDRGKDVRLRRRDLRAIQQDGVVDKDSNYCFGEGGAGAYSDGKLYTRSSKRGDIHRVLRLLVEHGAKADILIDAHPHIGSNKLPAVVAAIRDSILERKGEVHFSARCTDFIIKGSRCLGVVVNDRQEIIADAVVVATGHSARDIYELCRLRGIRTELKAFAMGVRAEHPQALIDEIQYKQRPRNPLLEAASYRLAEQVDGRGVYSFCMCPGGLIVPAATAPGELVVNGMSMSRRDSRYANSGIVVEIRAEDLQAYRKHGDHAGLAFQHEVETSMFKANGDGSQRVPAQGLVDFSEGRVSKTLASCSYIPGTHSAPLHELLPESLRTRLQRAFRLFDRSMKGYFTNEAVLTAVESRTSTPLKIPRDNDSLEHIEIKGLYPCGEGAGYAGGIVSAAMDGQRVASAIAQTLQSRHGNRATFTH